MPTHTFGGQDYLVVITAAILMVANLLGAGFAIRRLWIRAKSERATTAGASWRSGLAEGPIRVLRVTSFSVILLVFANVWIAERSHALGISDYLHNVIVFFHRLFSP
jgi:hypothetical protein